MKTQRERHQQAKECQRLLENPQKVEEKHGTEGTSPADTLISDFWPPKLQEIKFLLFKPPYFVMICYGSPKQLI